MLGLVAILQLLGLSQVLTPIQGMVDGVLGFLPNLIGAGIVFFVGALLAKVVRQLVHTALAAMPFDRWLKSAGSKASSLPGAPATSPAGPPPPPPGQPAAPHPGQPKPPHGYGGPAAPQGSGASIPKTVATVVYALIMIVVSIAALQILGIQSVSRPAEQMLQSIFDAVPVIIAAGLMLALGVFIARFVGDIVEQVLDGVGLDRQIAELDVLPADTKVVPVVAKIAQIAQIAIVLFFAVMAAQLLDFPQTTAFLSEVLGLGGKVIFGAAIIAAGLFIANLLAKLLTGVGATIVKDATIVLFVAMGLKYMGNADSIIELGFGALVVGGAAAAALAFGRLSDKAQAPSEPSSTGDQQV